MLYLTNLIPKLSLLNFYPIEAVSDHVAFQWVKFDIF